MNAITQKLMEVVAGFKGAFEGAFNIREDGQCAGRRSTKNVSIQSKRDGPGLVITVRPGSGGEKVYIPACVTRAGVRDLVYNDFHIGEGARVTIVAGCGVHSDGEEEARHNGIHRFYLAKGAYARYEEKHVGTGAGTGVRRIDPVTEAYLDEDACLEMDTAQLGGVNQTQRSTKAQLAAGARLTIVERLVTDGADVAATDFQVEMNGPGAGVDLVSRSVARGHSQQRYHSKIVGNCLCTGHSECDAILVDQGTVSAIPELYAGHVDASLIHEAAIGKIAGEQILKLRTLGMTEQEAERAIIDGFLRG